MPWINLTVRRGTFTKKCKGVASQFTHHDNSPTRITFHARFRM